jgi:hypothetical protein
MSLYGRREIRTGLFRTAPCRETGRPMTACIHPATDMVGFFPREPLLIGRVPGRSAHRGKVPPDPPPGDPLRDPPYGIVERVDRGAPV